jgi:Fe-S-cluster containining protein
MTKRLPVFYTCEKCPAFCCTYPETLVTAKDLRRLARYFDIDVETAGRRFTKRGPDPETRILRHRDDDAFLTACRFLDSETRRCTIYQARPAACRSYPGTPRCGYYDFLSAERRRQEAPDLVLAAWVTDL